MSLFRCGVIDYDSFYAVGRNQYFKDCSILRG